MQKKGKLTMTITIGIMCLILTFVIFIQVKTISQTDITELTNMREDELQTELTSLKTKYEEVNKKITETRAKITEYQTTINDSKSASEVLSKELKENQDLVGINDVTGQGIIVTLEDNESTNTKITATDLLELLNELKSAGAEAISINGQRIVYDSYVASINGTYISINGLQAVVSPYVVKAIGNMSYLESALSLKSYGYVDKKISAGKTVTITRSESITIEKYTGDLGFEYVKEGE